MRVVKPQAVGRSVRLKSEGRRFDPAPTGIRSTECGRGALARYIAQQDTAPCDLRQQQLFIVGAQDIDIVRFSPDHLWTGAVWLGHTGGARNMRFDLSRQKRLRNNSKERRRVEVRGQVECEPVF
jgi:hypothetical protein